MGKFDNVFAYSLAGGTANSGSGTGTGTGTGTTAGLVAEWKMEQASGNRLDTSGNNNTLVASGAIASAAGKVGLAAVFNGTAKLSLPSVSQLNLATDFSIAFWVKFIDTANYAMIFSKYSSSPASGLAIDIVGGKFRVIFLNSPTDTARILINSATTLNLNTYYFIAFTHNAATKTLDFTINRSVSGITVDTVNGNPNPYNFTLVDNNKDIVVGGLADSNLYIPQAHIDQVRIYNRVLSSAELDTLYAEA